jgi:hypothetical protein
VKTVDTKVEMMAESLVALKAEKMESLTVA